MKKLLSAFAILVAVSLIAAPERAQGTSLGLYMIGSPFTIAAELLQCGPVYLFPIHDSYSTGQNQTPPLPPGQITQSTDLTLTLTGGAVFDTSMTIYICDGFTTTDYGDTSTGSGSGFSKGGTVATFYVQKVISGGPAGYTFENAPCNPSSTNTGLLASVEMPAGTTAGATSTMCVSSSYPSTYDPNIYSCVTGFVVVKNQFTATLNMNTGAPDNTYIDFASNQTTFVPTDPVHCPAVPPYDTKDCAYAALLITSDETIGQRVTITYPHSGSAAQSMCLGTINSPNDYLLLTVQGNLQGLDEFDYNDVTTSITASSTEPITQKLMVPGSAVQICAASAPGLTTKLGQIPLSLCVDWPREGVTSTWPLGTPLVQGCEYATVQLWNPTCPSSGTAAGLVRTLTGPSYAWCLWNNATSFYIPYLSTDPSVITSCTLNNFSVFPPAATNGPAGVTLDILSSESETGITTSSLSLGSLSANQTGLITFSGDTVKNWATPSGASATIGVPTSPATRYSARVNINATALGADFECVQTDPSNPSGYKRNVQVTTNPNFGPNSPAPLQ